MSEPVEYTPLHEHLGWWNVWQDLLKKAKRNDNDTVFYQQQATVAQMNYVCLSAQYFSEVRP